MLFCAGTQEIGDMRKGEFNLTPEGWQMLRNAIAYLLLPEPELEPEP
ncbi:MAG: hypothetical protein ABIF19_15275 [Planctomycetota bacterium]